MSICHNREVFCFFFKCTRAALPGKCVPQIPASLTSNNYGFVQSCNPSASETPSALPGNSSLSFSGRTPPPPPERRCNICQRCLCQQNTGPLVTGDTLLEPKLLLWVWAGSSLKRSQGSDVIVSHGNHKWHRRWRRWKLIKHRPVTAPWGEPGALTNSGVSGGIIRLRACHFEKAISLSRLIDCSCKRERRAP